MADDRAHRRAAVLQAALAHVVFEGWSAAALRAGAEQAGFPAEEAGILFPGGPREAVDAFLMQNDARMSEALAAMDLADVRIRDRIALALRTRLEQVEPAKEAVRRTLGFLALPGNAGLASRGLYRTVDTVWRAIGDRSTDFSFYTKRGLLAGVYTATLLYWLEDRSEGHAETWAFFDRRIANVMAIPKLTGALRQAAAKCAGPLRRPFARRKGNHGGNHWTNFNEPATPPG